MTAKNIYARIADHAAAFARFEVATIGTDECAAKLQGRTITEADEAEYQAADALEEQAFRALLAAVPASVVEHRRKIRYLLMHCEDGNELDKEEIELLFGSLLEFAPRDPWRNCT